MSAKKDRADAQEDSMYTDIRRGDIWMAEVPESSPFSRTIHGYRPVFVLSSNTTNVKGWIVTVAPMTSKMHHEDGAFRVPLTPDAHNCLDKPSLVLTDQIMTMDRRQLTHWIGVASNEDMTRVEAAAKAALGL